MAFEDHFSRLATQYAKYRPRYPAELFAYLADLAPAHDLAWDSGTGSGQVALMLAEHFQQVIATDASAAQIASATPHERVDYRVEPAEETSIAAASVNLTVAGTAVHWFDFDRYYAEVRRVSKPGAVLAVWTYHLVKIASAIDAHIVHYYSDVLAGYWPPRIAYLAQHYRTLPFPFDELTPPEMAITAEWTLDHLLGFLASWSAVKGYVDDYGHHPLETIIDDLRRDWGPPERSRTLVWPLHFRIGRLAG